MMSGLTDPAIHRADHPLDLDAAVGPERDLGHLRNIGIERFMHGDPAEFAFWEGLAPACLLGDEIQDAQVTGMVAQ